MSDTLVTWWPICHLGIIRAPTVLGVGQLSFVVVQRGAVGVVQVLVWWVAVSVVQGGWWLWSEGW